MSNNTVYSILSGLEDDGKHLQNSISMSSLISILVLALLVPVFSFARAGVITYPPPPGLVTSPDFSLTVNGIPVWVEKIGSDVHTESYSLYGDIQMEYLNVARFSGSGPFTIRIIAPANIDSFMIRPRGRNIQAVTEGKELTFSINGPQKLYIEINGLPHLAVFADPLEENPPKEGDPGVVYFGPGVHAPGQIDLQSGQIVYIAGGALVQANIRGKDLHNVQIRGRGILQGNVKVTGADNLHVEGIFIRNTKGWTNTLTDCRHSSYRNVKVFGYEAIYSVDGINPVSCRDFVIDDCFMRCRDDCVAIKSISYDLRVDSIQVTRCVMVGWACSDGVTIGFELNGGPVQNILVKDCDILYARSGGRTGGHSAFSIVCDGPAWVQNIRYEDIRVEENVEFKNLELIVTPGTYYGEDAPGHIRGVYLKDVQWANTAKPFIIYGYSNNNRIEDVTFDHCRIGDRIITGTNDADFRINEFTRNIAFTP